MKIIVLFITTLISINFSTSAKKASKKKHDTFLKEIAASSCKCVDTVNTFNKTSKEISNAIHDCIQTSASAYSLMEAFKNINLDKEKKKNDTGKTIININIDPSPEIYNKIERYMMENCPSLKLKVASNDVTTNKSFSSNQNALELYQKGLEEFDKKNFESAIDYYTQALKIDSGFAFAWDNLGICYRQTEQFDKAIFAYKKSLQIEPRGITPLQNLAVAYQLKGEPEKAIRTYEQMLLIDSSNAEVYYGIGVINFSANEYAKSLNNFCKAYLLYIEQKSPYRTDAEKMINLIYAEMKKNGKEKQFNAILKEYNISSGH